MDLDDDNDVLFVDLEIGDCGGVGVGTPCAGTIFNCRLVKNHAVAVNNTPELVVIAVFKSPVVSANVPIPVAPSKKPTSPAVRRRARAWAR